MYSKWSGLCLGCEAARTSQSLLMSHKHKWVVFTDCYQTCVGWGTRIESREREKMTYFSSGDGGRCDKATASCRFCLTSSILFNLKDTSCNLHVAVEGCQHRLPVPPSLSSCVLRVVLAPCQLLLISPPWLQERMGGWQSLSALPGVQWRSQALLLIAAINLTSIITVPSPPCPHDSPPVSAECPVH